jgi:hypothetical protein
LKNNIQTLLQETLSKANPRRKELKKKKQLSLQRFKQ